MHGALLEKQIDGFRRWNLDELRFGEAGRGVRVPELELRELEVAPVWSARFRRSRHHVPIKLAFIREVKLF
jgi:hypothetical protein